MVKRQGWITSVHLEEGLIPKWASQPLDILGHGHFSGHEPWVVPAWRPEKCGASGFLSLGLYVSRWVGIGRKRGLRAERAVSVLDYGPAVVCHPCRIGPGAACRLPRAESERRCRAPGQPPGGALCHGRGRCDCGVCICHVSEPGVYFGPLCECHEWVCETYDGSICAGKGRGCSSAGHTAPQEPGRLPSGFLPLHRAPGWGQNDSIPWPSRKLPPAATAFLLLVNSGIMVCILSSAVGSKLKWK